MGARTWTRLHSFGSCWRLVFQHGNFIHPLSEARARSAEHRLLRARRCVLGYAETGRTPSSSVEPAANKWWKWPNVGRSGSPGGPGYASLSEQCPNVAERSLNFAASAQHVVGQNADVVDPGQTLASRF